ncbi:MAG: hypothetical protein IPN34_04705 [Planctomycetes bacterium]|nr:hypothetical protein [Planctomycetota bacterium]
MSSRRFARGLLGAVWLALCGCGGDDRYAFDDPTRRAPASRPAAAPGSEHELPPLTGQSVDADDPLFIATEAQGELARVEGEAIRAEELLDALLFFQREATQELLRKTIEFRLVRLEARRLSARVPVARLEAEEAGFLRRAEEEVKRFGDGSLSFEAYLRGELASDPALYARSLRRFVALGLLRDRVIRADQMQRERLVVRGLSLRDRALAQRAWQDLHDGASFEILAQQIDPEAPPERRGRWPALPLDDPHPIVGHFGRQDLQGFQPPIEQRLGATSVWHVVELMERLPADPRSFADLAPEIEVSLAAQPVGREEYLVWLRGALRRWRIEGPEPR